MKKRLFLQCLLIISINIVFAQTKLVRFQEKGKWGLYDEINDKVIVKTKYDKILPLKSGFIAYDYGENEGKNIWIDAKGKEYTHLLVKGKDFYDGLLLCENAERNNETTFINEKGESIIMAYYDKATDFSEGFALVSVDGNTFGGYDDSKANVFFIDSKGKPAFPNIEKSIKSKILFDSKSKFVNGRVIIRVDNQETPYHLMDTKGKTVNIQDIIKKHDKSLKNEQKGLFYINPIDFDLYDGGLLVAKTFNQSEELKLLMFDEKYNVLFPNEHIVSASNLLNGKRLIVMVDKTKKAPENSDPILYYKYAFINEKNKIIKEISSLEGSSFVLYQFPDNKIFASSGQNNQAYLFDEKLNLVSNTKIESDKQKLVVTIPNTQTTYIMPILELKDYWNRESYGGGEIDAFKLPSGIEKILMCHSYDSNSETEIKNDIDCASTTGCNDCMIFFKKDGKIGAFSSTGQIVIPAEYEEFYDGFGEGYRAIVKKNGKWGEISRTNTIVAPFKIEEFKFVGRVPFTKINGKWGADGLLPHEFDECPQKFQENSSEESAFFATYLIKKSGKYGLIDVKVHDKVIIDNILPCEYDTINYNTYLKEGIAQKQDKKYYFNSKRHIFPFEYDNFQKTYFRGNYDTHLIVIKNNKQGILRLSDNKLVIPCEYDEVEIRSYKDEFIFVKKNNKYGIINLENQPLVPCEFDYVSRNFGEQGGYFLVEKNKKQGIMAANKYVIPLVYDELGRFYSDPAIPIGVKKGNKWGFVDKKFKQILPFEFEEDSDGMVYGFEINKIMSPNKDFSTAILRKNGKSGILDNKGRVLVPFEYEAIEKLYYYNDEDIKKPLFRLFKKAGDKGVELYWDGKKLITNPN
ncbi:MAG: WG repeat-containing protein [Raineya sp.]|jgi:hypothetical protein|nr:WG repeat-containing protein [Raineya sp.]